MFTKEDYENYFGQIARIERRMLYGVYDLSSEINDLSIARILKKIGDDEVRHYGYVLKMFRLSAVSDHSEKRIESRERYLGTILLRKTENAALRKAKAYGVNLSKTGICLECRENLLAGEALDLEIRPFDRDEILLRRGRVVWSKEVEPDFYISGIVLDV